MILFNIFFYKSSEGKRGGYFTHFDELSARLYPTLIVLLKNVYVLYVFIDSFFTCSLYAINSAIKCSKGYMNMRWKTSKVCTFDNKIFPIYSRGLDASVVSYINPYVKNLACH